MNHQEKISELETKGFEDTIWRWITSIEKNVELLPYTNTKEWKSITFASASCETNIQVIFKKQPKYNASLVQINIFDKKHNYYARESITIGKATPGTTILNHYRDNGSETIINEVTGWSITKKSFDYTTPQEDRSWIPLILWMIIRELEQEALDYKTQQHDWSAYLWDWDRRQTDDLYRKVKWSER